MDTSQIQSMIAEQCDEAHSESDLHDLLAVVAERQGASARPADLEHGVRFVLGYIRQVPYMMKVAWTAAGNVGLQDACTICESDDVFSMTRIVGYYSRISNWNKSKIGELKDRHRGNYNVGTSAPRPASAEPVVERNPVAT